MIESATANVLMTSIGLIFLHAWSFKTTDTSSLGETLRKLGFDHLSNHARFIPWFELGIALAVLGFLPVMASTVFLLAAAGAIGGAGAVALKKGVAVPCSCFSSAGKHELGVRQLVLSVALFIAAALLFFDAPPFVVRDAAARLMVASLIGISIHLVGCAPSWLVLRGYRRAMSGSYPA